MNKNYLFILLIKRVNLIKKNTIHFQNYIKYINNISDSIINNSYTFYY